MDGYAYDNERGEMKMNTFTEVWDKMDRDKGITKSGKSVVMTPEQFRNMLQQFYDVGYKHGRKFGKDEGIRSARDLENMIGKDKDSHGLDFLNNMFGGGKR